ncbi:hypothetical protein NB037_05320 [Rathayibacter sp. ZW T2_19]|uniref:Uncharacterized protein n=1 Tax=Rathayibacter rubneri TaxID=2950106 RepID=A0A9X2DVD7_9MICO|nr:hypothetical protein [Rathayibacter rubneri]MCM6761835.1 hypothetical protein [Rathayibacter rubneri]
METEHGEEPEVAAEHLAAELRYTRGGRLRGLVDAALGGGVITVFDLVVTRLDTGAVVIRTAADIGDPHDLLGRVRLDLETTTTAEFLEVWGPE